MKVSGLKSQDLTSKMIGICEKNQCIESKTQIMRRIRNEEARKDKKEITISIENRTLFKAFHKNKD